MPRPTIWLGPRRAPNPTAAPRNDGNWRARLLAIPAAERRKGSVIEGRSHAKPYNAPSQQVGRQIFRTAETKQSSRQQKRSRGENRPAAMLVDRAADRRR